jgi:hypothetical protein
MTSKEIDQEGVWDRQARDTENFQAMMLKEIAFQLAQLNEKLSLADLMNSVKE